MIEKLVRGQCSVAEFEQAYYDYYLEKVPDGVLTDEDHRFFGSVQEKLDWTAKTPTTDEKKGGWLTQEEFVKWVRLQRDLYFGRLA